MKVLKEVNETFFNKKAHNKATEMHSWQAEAPVGQKGMHVYHINSGRVLGWKDGLLP